MARGRGFCLRLQLARLARPLLVGPPPRRAVLAPTCAAEPCDGVRAPPPRHFVRRRCPPLLRSVTPPRRRCAAGPRLPHGARALLRVPCTHTGNPLKQKAGQDTRSNLPVSGHLALALFPSPFSLPELAVPAPLLLTTQMGRSVSGDCVREVRCFRLPQPLSPPTLRVRTTAVVGGRALQAAATAIEQAAEKSVCIRGM